ncbi:unnamed protein product [Polarella glacialis]|uniref:Uncharacterized protein n=1 Tax=Polarella glacialis TaxID=89957 RepID=A0A813JK09_POLGL|nr:unnamed protein product [Polarella glacialis]
MVLLTALLAHMTSPRAHDSKELEAVLAKLWDAHLAHEFDPEQKSTAYTLATMTETASVNHVPTLVGASGHQLLSYFYQNHFIFQNPPMSLQLIKRTISADAPKSSGSLVDEMVVNLTHNAEVDWLLPGVKPTGLAISFPLVVSVDFTRHAQAASGDAHDGWRLLGERIYWDQATVLQQVGKLVPGQPLEVGLPISGPEQAAKVVDVESVRSNEMLRGLERYMPPLQ